MSGFTKRSPWDRVTLVAIVLASGCQTSPSSSTTSNSPQLTPVAIGEVRNSQQLIVKLKPHTIVCDAAGIAHLSAVTKVTLEHVRPMSGEACVISQFADSAAGFLRGQEILKRHPAVEWLEEDRVMKGS